MTHEATVQPLPTGSHSSRSRAPHWETRDNLIDKSLAHHVQGPPKSLGSCGYSRRRDQQAESYLGPFEILGQVQEQGLLEDEWGRAEEETLPS